MSVYSLSPPLSLSPHTHTLSHTPLPSPVVYTHKIISVYYTHNPLPQPTLTHTHTHTHTHSHTSFPLQLSSDKSDKDHSSSSQSTSSGISNGLEAVKVWQERFHDVESKFKDSMVANAQLYNEKTALVFQVEVLKDR